MENSVIVELIRTFKKLLPAAKITLVESKLSDNLKIFEIQDGKIRGSGAAVSPEEALNKAISEFIERRAFSENSKTLNAQTSSGFAAHLNANLAIGASRTELIERDLFLVCWYAQVMPAWVPIEGLKLSARIFDFLNSFESLGIKIKIGVLAQCGSTTVSVGLLHFGDYSNGAASYGLATEAANSLQTALDKVILSLARIANLVITRKHSSLSLFEPISADEVRSPFQHLEYYLNPVNRRFLDPWWESTSTEVFSVEAEKICSRVIESSLADGLGRKVAFSESDGVLNYFSGLNVDMSAVRGRLSSLGLQVKFDNTILHPLS